MCARTWRLDEGDRKPMSADPEIVSEETVQTWRSRDGHTISLVRFAEDTVSGGVQMGYLVHCSPCGWLAGGGNEHERHLAVEDAEYHVDWHNGE
jgi:hypothetical protein